MTGKTGRFIVTPRLLEELTYHDMRLREMGPLYTFMDRALVPEADVVVLVHDVKKVPPNFKPYVEPHTHEVSQLYNLIGELTFEATLDGERHEVTAPASIFIPAGVKHTIRPLRGSGYVVVVLRSGKYE